MIDFEVYYGSPAEFDPVNTAYLQLEEELEDSLVIDLCDYIRSTYGNQLTVPQIEAAFEEFGIDYPNLRQYNKDRIDEFDII